MTDRQEDILNWLEKKTKTNIRYVLKGGFWLTLEKGVIFLAHVGLYLAFARWLSKEALGTYQYVFAIANLVGLVSLPGLNTALVRAVAKGREGMFKVIVKTRFRYALIGAVILLAVSGWYYVNGNQLLGTSFAVTALFFPMYFGLNEYREFYQGRGDFRSRAIVSVLATIARISVMLWIILYSDNVVLLLTALFGVEGIVQVVAHLRIHKGLRNTVQDDESVLYGKHLTLMDTLSWVGNYLDSIILWHVAGPAAVATYTFAYLPVKRVRQLIPIQELALTKFAQGEFTPEAKRNIWHKWSRLFIIFVPITILMIGLGPFVYTYVFPGYEEAVFMFQVLSLTILGLPFVLLVAALNAHMKTRALYIHQIVGPGSRIVLVLILAPIWGIWGIIAAILIAQLVTFTLLSYLFHRA